MEDPFEKVKDLFRRCFDVYYKTSCQCAFPRYHQMTGIDCVDTGDAYSCYETEMLLYISEPYFIIDTSPHGQAGNTRIWTCKKCGSTYDLEWQDFSIQVNRQTMKVNTQKVPLTGKPGQKPIPLFLGLSGHSFPPATEITQASFEDIEKYMLEQ